MEQTVDGLRGPPKPEEQIQEWRLAWDELTDVQLEVQEEDTEGVTQRKVLQQTARRMSSKLGRTESSYDWHGVHETK